MAINSPEQNTPIEQSLGYYLGPSNLAKTVEGLSLLAGLTLENPAVIAVAGLLLVVNVATDVVIIGVKILPHLSSPPED
ncbi:hypothetical protein A3A66_04900 [Microgenomates group bacterium RIFCSPLOWO2_01_FULL_46_13]|nr:MAG: hypothetical protein A2783_02265 [Microgenomates group bacterium RIFCSPHIGHO2_01_FULL_45_11]OGV94301.1 MAG: hypothetical protein A3A66_04900 [Microgenomates group bacterium RIFCSPLOWO2_01_FULL_46_13]